MFCSKCGTELDDNLNFCTKCGNKIISANAEITRVSELNEPQAEEIILTREKTKIELSNQWPNHEALGTLTITNKQIHYAATKAIARIGLLGVNEIFMRTVSNLSIPFSEIISITKKRNILDYGAFSFWLLLNNSPIINNQIPDTMGYEDKKELSIIVFKGAKELQKILEQQWKQPINDKPKIGVM